jgi:hypothetical protein
MDVQRKSEKGCRRSILPSRIASENCPAAKAAVSKNARAGHPKALPVMSPVRFGAIAADNFEPQVRISIPKFATVFADHSSD